MWFYDPEYLRRAAAACRRRDVLLIVDEIATGFGRTGEHLFASQHADIEPDVLCLGKALTGGMMSMAATLATDRVALVDRPHAPPLMHGTSHFRDATRRMSPLFWLQSPAGPTFMANPLASAIACASIDLLTSCDYDWRSKVAAIERQLVTELAPCASFPAVADVRVLGGIGVIELHSSSHDHSRLAEEFVQRGVWLRSFRNLVYTFPPYIIEPGELATLTAAMCDVLQNLPREPPGQPA